MIAPTEADIGRRVVYAPATLDHVTKGVLARLDGRWAGITYDGSLGPIWTGLDDLHWADDFKAKRNAGKAA